MSEEKTYNWQGDRIGGDKVMGDKVGSDKVMGDKMTHYHSQNLAAAKDIKDLLDQLGNDYDSAPHREGDDWGKGDRKEPHIESQSYQCPQRRGNNGIGKCDRPSSGKACGGIAQRVYGCKIVASAHRDRSSVANNPCAIAKLYTKIGVMLSTVL